MIEKIAVGSAFLFLLFYATRVIIYVLTGV